MELTVKWPVIAKIADLQGYLGTNCFHARFMLPNPKYIDIIAKYWSA